MADSPGEACELALASHRRPICLLGLTSTTISANDNAFAKHGRLRVAKSGTHLEHADGTPFFFLADTAWTGPALSTEEEWKLYLDDRKKKGFTAIQFNCVSPWRTAPTDREGRTAYSIKDGKLIPNEEYFRQLDARLKAINDAGPARGPGPGLGSQEGRRRVRPAPKIRSSRS